MTTINADCRAHGLDPCPSCDVDETTAELLVAIPDTDFDEVAVHHEDDMVTLYAGDCLNVLRSLPDSSVDSVVTDPPYGLEFMGKEWDGADGFRRSLNPADVGRDNAFGRTSRTSPEYRTGNGYSETPRITDRPGSLTGYSGAAGQGVNHFEAGRPFQVWCEAWSREALRVLKPGGHMLAFGGTRTWHRLACAVEDAGFEIRDSLAWLYGSGFPKSLNLVDDDGERTGWGTALKPAFEPLVVGRKPLGGTVAANVLAHGTGALHIDACRTGNGEVSSGRWPTNVILDESQALVLDEQSGERPAGGKVTGNQDSRTGDNGIYGAYSAIENKPYGDTGGASRFFYVAKADAGERVRVNGVAHPTVKPLDIMRWLVRLVTPPGGVVLEPFAGSGTTVEACLLEGFRCIAIEREETYLPLVVQRINRRRDPVAAVRALTGDDAGLFDLLDGSS